MGMRQNRQRPLVKITAPPGQSPDDVEQHMKRWRQELAFAIEQHPDLAAKARRLGIVLDEGEPGHS